MRNRAVVQSARGSWRGPTDWRRYLAGHVRNLGDFAAECSRVLRPDAELFLTDLHPEAHSAGWRTGFRDHRGSAEIETIARSGDEVVNTFASNRFQCIGR